MGGSLIVRHVVGGSLIVRHVVGGSLIVRHVVGGRRNSDMTGAGLHIYWPCIHSRPRVGLDCQKRSRSGLCSKLPTMRSVGEYVAFSKLNVHKVKMFYFDYRIYSSCKLFFSITLSFY